MSKHQEHLETLSEIRSLMERSSRFISLSGLSGVAAGVIALAGAIVAAIYLEVNLFEEHHYYVIRQGEKWGMDYWTFFFVDAGVVLILALAAGIYFTTKKARKSGQKIWDPTARLMLINLAIPLGAGGIFCLILIHHGWFGLVAPTTLIFYGLALLNGGKYTLNDIRFLGITEIILGLIATYYLGYGLLFWAIGFGVLHIVYGIAMYMKYDR